MASLLPLPTLLSLLTIITLHLVQPSTSTRHDQSLNLPPTRVGFRIGLTHVDHNRNLTKLQLIQRSLHRGKLKLERLNEMATMFNIGNGILAPVFASNGEFLMNFTIGTPGVPSSAIVDTGSDLIWTQCKPCTKCFDQPMPIFNPSKSSTFDNISCTSELCEDLNIFKCDNGCKYLYSYGDESSTEGYMAKDTFIFEDSSGLDPVSIPNIGFGCGVDNQGSGLAEGSGLVGLGRGPLSLVSQLNFGKFSYCLTSIGENKTSTILFGSQADLNYSISGATYSTPLVQNPSQPTFYYVSLEGITIGETLLPISKSTLKLREDGSGGMIMDSGTTLTYLQEDAFHVVKREFTSQMKLRVSKMSDTIGLDLCFDLPTKDVSEISIPKLKFHFEGLDLELPAENYMVLDSETGVVCLAMAASSGMSIFGNVQQQNFFVLHDLDKETVSFVPTQCDQF